MNENKMIYYTKLMIRLAIVCISYLLLMYVIRYVTDMTVWVKAFLLIGMVGAMWLSIYNGRENRYEDFKQCVDTLSKLDEGSFTYFIERLYRTLGYYTKVQHQANNMHKTNEIILIKDNHQTVVHCYNKETINLENVQQLVGRMSYYPKATQAQILLIGTVSEEVHQLAELNHITLIEGSILQAQMSQAATLLEHYLEGAMSFAFWCHPVKWFKKHFLEEEPRFMNHGMWLQWVKLKLKDKAYQLSDVQQPEIYGVQFVAQKGIESIAIRCMGIDQQVTEKDLNALKASLPFFTARRGILITNSRVSYKMKILAKRYQLDLLNFDDFMKWLKNQENKNE